MKNTLMSIAFIPFLLVTAYGQHLEIVAPTSIREPILGACISDATPDYLSIINATRLSGRFAPMLNAHNGSDARTAFFLMASTLPAHDVVNDNFPLMTFDSRISPTPYQQNNGDHQMLTNRNLFGWATAGVIRMTMAANGFLGIGGVVRPKARVHVADGDVYIEDIQHGIIMKSPNGKCWKITIDDSGNFVKNQVDCP